MRGKPQTSSNKRQTDKTSDAVDADDIIVIDWSMMMMVKLKFVLQNIVENLLVRPS